MFRRRVCAELVRRHGMARRAHAAHAPTHVPNSCPSRAILKLHAAWHLYAQSGGDDAAAVRHLMCWQRALPELAGNCSYLLPHWRWISHIHQGV